MASKKCSFKIGDEVVGNERADYDITKTGWKGTVASLSDLCMSVIGPNRQGRRETFYVQCAKFDLVRQFVFAKPAKTMGGQKVKVTKKRDSERPYRADVTVKGKTLTLSYDKNGRFCPHGASSVDLVNA